MLLYVPGYQCLSIGVWRGKLSNYDSRQAPIKVSLFFLNLYLNYKVDKYMTLAIVAHKVILMLIQFAV